LQRLLGSLGPIIAEIFPVGNVASVWGIAGAFGATGAIVLISSIGHAAKTLGPEGLFVIMGCLHPAPPSSTFLGQDAALREFER